MSVLEKLKTYLPALLLLGANLLYLAIYGFAPLKYHPKLVLYNFLLFLIVGIVIFFKVSYHLYRGFKLREGDMHSKTKQQIKEILQKIELFCNYLRPGNTANLVYLYAVLALWATLSLFIPRFLMGVTTTLIFQLKAILVKDYGQQLDALWMRWKRIQLALLQGLPRYEEP